MGHDACWVPVELVLGVSVGVLPVTATAISQTRRRAPNQEVRHWTKLVETIRKEARTILENEAAGAGADGVVISELGLKMYEVESDHFVEVMFIGTAITAFGSARPQPRHKSSLFKTMLPAPRKPGPEPERPPSVRTNSIVRLSADER